MQAALYVNHAIMVTWSMDTDSSVLQDSRLPGWDLERIVSAHGNLSIENHLKKLCETA
jgi:hypothetical protein